MAVRRWTSRTRARVRGDLESVVSWWASPERRAEQRAHLETLDVLDFRSEESVEDGHQITERNWTTRRGLQVSQRVVSPVRPPEVAQRTADGRALLRYQTFQSRRWPGGREDRSRSDVVIDFRGFSERRTRVFLTATRHREGVPWWDMVLPPGVERRHRRMHLKDMAARCEHDLGTRKSAQRWFAVYGPASPSPGARSWRLVEGQAGAVVGHPQQHGPPRSGTAAKPQRSARPSRRRSATEITMQVLEHMMQVVAEAEAHVVSHLRSGDDSTPRFDNPGSADCTLLLR